MIGQFRYEVRRNEGETVNFNYFSGACDLSFNVKSERLKQVIVIIE